MISSRWGKGGDPLEISTTKLTIFLCIVFADYITGVLVAIKQRRISSSIGAKGILKKFGIIICAVLACLIDVFADTEIQIFVLLSLVINESFSILENLEKINVPVPKIFLSSLKALQTEDKTTEKKQKKASTR